MGFGLPFGKEEKMRKLIGKYVSDRVREKRAFGDLIKRLDAELYDENFYERFRANLETQYYQKQEKEWAKIKNKFNNLLNS